ncbi:MAG: hypothetical protein AAB542_00310 [Patescibacteria group bacterium]
MTIPSNPNYQELWLRWGGLAILDNEQSNDLLNHLHAEVKAGCELIGKTATEQVTSGSSSIFEKILPHIYSTTVSSVYGGYFLFLLVHKINPETDNLKDRNSTTQLGELWVQAFDKKELDKKIKSIDPVIQLMLDKIAEMRLEQLIALTPEIIKWKYQSVVTIQQHISWCVYQGYLLGEFEQNLAENTL